MWELVRVGAACGWFTLCAAAGIASYAAVVVVPVMVIVWLVRSRQKPAPANTTTDGRLMAAPSVVRSGDWSVAIVAGIVVLALYWLVVGGDIPRVN